MMKDAYGAGLRGNEKPKEKPKAKHGSVRRVSIEKAANGGFINTVEHHEKRGKGGMPTFKEPERHAHSDHAAAHAHAGEMMHQMSTPEEHDGGGEED